eukprot:TRINITY_DN55136_c0_g1_i1.p1 TRINITY_DN55136_c0_g1~~TRINITY_DN55136_c0_g1_i1.p1  ORF type:complete len:622 (-),score=71.30 TRINITY_DN55136_c0_g1_i1:28-1893(-)
MVTQSFFSRSSGPHACRCILPCHPNTCTHLRNSWLACRGSHVAPRDRVRRASPAPSSGIAVAIVVVLAGSSARPLSKLDDDIGGGVTNGSPVHVAESPPYHLCVFVPISPRSRKDAILARVALETWAAPGVRAKANASVVFLSPPGAQVHPSLARDTLSFPGDVDTDYKHLPIRTFRMWEYLGKQKASECGWYMKADADSYVNLRAVAERLACFDSEEQFYFGVTHVILPAWAAFQPIFFGHGGSGYMVSHGLLGDIGAWAPTCLEMTMESTQGDAMEDVSFALCLRSRGIQVLNYGFHATEFVVNFHQARDTLLNCTGVVDRQSHWDAQPAPLGACVLVVHPVERADDLQTVHACIRDWEERGSDCSIAPMQLARQAEVRLQSRNSEIKEFWDQSLLDFMHRCFSTGRVHSCQWRLFQGRCFGLGYFRPATSASSCAEACCASVGCHIYEFAPEEGCWLGELQVAVACQVTGPQLDDAIGMSGAFKLTGHGAVLSEMPPVAAVLSAPRGSGIDATDRIAELLSWQCWTELPGKYLPHWTAAMTDCFNETEAKRRCLALPECDGVTRQWDMCGGSGWTLRGGSIGRTEQSYDAENLESRVLRPACRQGNKGIAGTTMSVDR